MLRKRTFSQLKNTLKTENGHVRLSVFGDKTGKKTDKRTQKTDKTDKKTDKRTLKTDKRTNGQGIYIYPVLSVFCPISKKREADLYLFFLTWYNKLMNHPEANLQADIVRELTSYRLYVLMIPNGEVGKLSAPRYQRLVAQGFRRGAADLIVFSEDAKAHFLEIKCPGKKQSPGQIDFENKCKKRGWNYKIVESVPDAIIAAQEWGLIPHQSAKMALYGDFVAKDGKSINLDKTDA